jgi:hypothetical protein
VIAIALIVLGIVFLCKKRIPYGKKRELRGPLAVLVCLLLIVPPCIFLVWGFNEGFQAGKNNRELDQDKLIEFTLTVELPTYAGVILVSWLIVATCATPVKRRRRRDYDDYDDYDDRYDERSRRPRYDDYDDRRRDEDYHDEPRRRDDDRRRDEDYHERPRGRDDDRDYDDRGRRRRDYD